MGSRPCSRCRTGKLIERCKEVNPDDRGPPTPNAGWCCLQIPGCCSSCKAPVQWQLLAPPLPSASSIGTRLGGALRSTTNDTIPTPTLSSPPVSVCFFLFLLEQFVVEDEECSGTMFYLSKSHTVTIFEYLSLKQSGDQVGSGRSFCSVRCMR